MPGSQNSLEQFRQLVLEDVALQEQLREPSTRAAFVELVLRLGRERGHTFTAEDVEAALRAGKRAWIERWT